MHVVILFSRYNFIAQLFYLFSAVVPLLPVIVLTFLGLELIVSKPFEPCHEKTYFQTSLTQTRLCNNRRRLEARRIRFCKKVCSIN